MRDEKLIHQRAQLYQLYLKEAMAQRQQDGDNQSLNMLILILVDKLEALLWVLGLSEDNTIPVSQGVRH